MSMIHAVPPGAVAPRPRTMRLGRKRDQAVRKAVRDVARVFMDNLDEGDYHGFAASTEEARELYERAIGLCYPWITVEWVFDENLWACGLVAVTRMRGRVPLPDPVDDSPETIEQVVAAIRDLESWDRNPTDEARLAHLRAAREACAVARARLRGAATDQPNGLASIARLGLRAVDATIQAACRLLGDDTPDQDSEPE